MKTLKTLRKKQGLTQKELAKVLNVSQNTISDWESDRTQPDIDAIKRMAIFFKVTIDHLLDFNYAKYEEVPHDQIERTLKYFGFTEEEREALYAGKEIEKELTQLSKEDANSVKAIIASLLKKQK